jgi:hypothetical protein
MSNFFENADTDAYEKVSFFATTLLYTISSSLTMIEAVSYKIKNKDLDNSNLYLIVFACDKLAEIIDKLPVNEFQKYCETTMKKDLSKMSCYIVDKRSEINCNDFYENFLKRKMVNEELLSKVELKKGGLGGLMIGIAVTALALLQTTTPVLSAVFNSDNFVIQHRALHGMGSSRLFREASRENPIMQSHIDTKSHSVQSIYRLQEDSNEDLHEDLQEDSQDDRQDDRQDDLEEPFTEDQEEEFARLDANMHGVCATNSFVAELCTGGCPSKEEWERLSPKILERIQNAYREKFTSYDVMNGIYLPPSSLSLGIPTTKLYDTKFVNVPDGLDVEWFRRYFSEGAEKHFSKENSYSDMAIATVRKPHHAINIMYNMKNQKLCLHDENYKVDWKKHAKKFVLPLHSEEYICEEGFFEEYQLKELNKIGRPVVETTDNIFKLYSEINKHSIEEKIFQIQPPNSIFLIDKSKNTGNINQYIEILKDVRRNMIKGELDGIEFLEAEKERLKISDETIEILYEAVGIHEQAFNPGFKSYNPRKTRKKLKSLEEKLKADASLSRGGNKKYVTGKIKKRVSKKERQKRKSKKKTK